VIDFYAGAAQPDKPIAIHMDVRPALDSVGALADRLAHQWREAKVRVCGWVWGCWLVCVCVCGGGVERWLGASG
jgi:hypothetical protein